MHMPPLIIMGDKDAHVFTGDRKLSVLLLTMKEKWMPCIFVQAEKHSCEINLLKEPTANKDAARKAASLALHILAQGGSLFIANLHTKWGKWVSAEEARALAKEKR